MIKSFITLILLLIVMVTSITIHYIQFPKKRRVEKMIYLTTLTKQSNLSLSITYTNGYPDMQKIDRMDFVYDNR